MTSPRWDASDERLMEELEAAVSPVQVPERLLDLAKAAFVWHNVDEELELLALCFDSSMEDAALVRRPAHAAPRALVFEGRNLGLEVEVTNEGVTGQLIPPGYGHVSLITPGGPFAETDTDETGCFLLARPLAGPVRLKCQTLDSSLVTEWMPF